jgi:hypothetical protein
VTSVSLEGVIQYKKTTTQHDFIPLLSSISEKPLARRTLESVSMPSASVSQSIKQPMLAYIREVRKKHHGKLQRTDTKQERKPKN